MKIRLQHFVGEFENTTLNVFDLDFWKTHTHLASFGVELRVRRGYVVIELRLYRGKDAPVMLHRMSQAGKGSTYSPPYFPAEMSGVILPVITSRAPLSQFDLSFGTNDLPPTPSPNICFVTGGVGARAHRASFEKFLESDSRVAGDGAHMVIVENAAASGQMTSNVTHLAASASRRAPIARAAPEIAYGAMSGNNFSHLCAIEGGAGVHPSMFARMTETIRFLKPGYVAAAAVHPGTSEKHVSGPSGAVGPDDPAWPLEFTGGGALLGDISANATGVREPAAAIPGMIAVPMTDLRAIGLPDPRKTFSALTDYSARLTLSDRRVAVPMSLAVTGSVETPSGDEAQLRATWREYLTTLLAQGLLRNGADVKRRIEALARLAPPDSARAMLAALAELFSLPEEVATSTDAPVVPQRRRWNVLGRDASTAPSVDVGAVLDKLSVSDPDYAALQERQAREHAQAIDPLAGMAAGGINSTEDREQALWEAVVASHRRLDAMRIEMTALNIALANQIDDRFQYTGIENPARTRSDLERASGLALAACENRHRGQKAVIVGNGPSLRIPDLDRLSDCVTFGSNKIFLAFDQTKWRPTYYSVEDHLILTDNFDRIRDLRGVTKIFPDNMRDYGYHATDTIFVHRIPPKSWTDPLSDPKFPRFSFDLFEGLHWGSTVVYSQLQMAVFMGCTEIYLIGVDHNYQLPTEQQANTYVSEGEHNHFHKDYFKPGTLWHQPNLPVLDVSYRRAYEACSKAGIKVMNASRKTKLEAFPCVDFDTVFPE